MVWHLSDDSESSGGSVGTPSQRPRELLIIAEKKWVSLWLKIALQWSAGPGTSSESQ